MTQFEDIRLGDIVPIAIEITRGFPTQRAVASGNMPVMSIAALRTGSAARHFADPADVIDLNLDVARPGDILVAIEGGTIGETMVVPEGHREFVPSQQAATLRVIDAGRIDPWYLGAWLSTEVAEERLRRLARGSGIQRIAIRNLTSLTIGLPPLEEQREIGERFRAFDASIRSHRAITSCLEQLLEADLVVTFADLAAADDRTTASPSRGRRR